jgi:hypothetical protein
LGVLAGWLVIEAGIVTRRRVRPESHSTDSKVSKIAAACGKPFRLLDIGPALAKTSIEPRRLPLGVFNGYVTY